MNMTTEINNEETPHTLESLTQKYGQLAAQLGSLEYQVRIYQAEAAGLITRMQEINQLAAKIKEVEASKIQHPPATPAVPPLELVKE